MGLFSTVVVCLLASLTLADLPVVSPLPRTTTASYVTASVLPALVLGNGWVVSATYNATYCINTSSTKVNSGSGVPPDYVGALPASPTSIFPISDTVFGLISGKWFWAFNYTCQLQYAWVTPDNSTLDVAQSYVTGYAVPLTLNGKVYVGSMNLSTSGTSSLFVLSATGYVWSAPLPFYKSTWAPSTNPWGTAVYVRSSSYNSNTGSYVCIVNLANKTVTNAATLFQYDNVGYFPLFVSANTWLAVTIDNTLYFFNGMTGALISTKPLPTSCSNPLAIQFSNATMCLYYACYNQLTVYNWSTSAATAYQLYGSNTITSMAIAPCGCVFVSSSYYLGWYSMYGVWNSSVVNVDYIINNLGWANTTLMLQMTNYIYGINPWTAEYKWGITRDRNTNAPAVTTNMGWTIFFTDAGSSYMQNSQLQGYDTILPNNSFATTFPVTSNSFDKSNYYYNATGWTSYYTASNMWYAVNTFNGASKVADMSLESIPLNYESGLVPYGPWVCTAPQYRALCWNAQSATTISSATFLSYSSQAVQISGKYLFVQSYYESYYVDLSLPTLTGVSLAIGTSNSVVGAAFIGSTRTVLTVTKTKLFSKTLLTSSGDESPIRSSALFEYYRSAPAMYNSDFYVAAALNNADYGVRRVGGLTGLAYGGFVITKGQSASGFVWLIPGQGGKYGGGVFYVFNSTSVTAMDASNGALFFTTWMPNLDIIRQTQAFKPVVTLEGALLISTSSYLVVLSAITGKLLWYQTSAFEFPPQYTYGSIYWSSKSYTIAVSNPGNGQIYAEFQYQSSYSVQSVVVTQQPDNSTRLVAVSRYSNSAAVFTGEVVAAFATAAPAGNPFAGGFAPSNNGPSLLDLLKGNKAYIAGIVIGALVVIVVVVLVVRNRSQKPRDEDYVPMNPSTPSHTQV